MNFCSYFSSKSSDEMTGLEDYVARMKKGQTRIFFVSGQSKEEVETSPFVERLVKRGYEVLYFIEPVDEYTIQVCPTTALFDAVIHDLCVEPSRVRWLQVPERRQEQP